jgi:ketosteroid isomerase-like protein
MKIRSWQTITIGVATASLAIAISAAPSQATSRISGAPVKHNDSGLRAKSLSQLQLTSRKLSKREKANLAVVLHAYHVAEGDTIDVDAFVNTFTKDGVLNDVVGNKAYRGEHLGDVVTNTRALLPDVHRELKRITVHGNVISVEVSIQGTFKGPLQTPAGIVQPTGAKVDVPTADFWYLRNGKIRTFNCYLGYSVMFAQMGVNPDWASAVDPS